MLKNKNGITLIALVFMIIVILILTSIFIATSLRALNEAKNTEIQSEIRALEDAISERYTSYVKNNKSVNSSLIGASPTSKWSSESDCIEAVLNTIDYSKLSEEDKENRINKISGDIARDYKEYVKVISKREANSLGIQQFSQDNVYVVDYYTTTAYGPIKED
ncbi:MAG: type II secretion system protein [Clostridia bacterium]|nr:type II secretion system protein [Clostridia bacterium]